MNNDNNEVKIYNMSYVEKALKGERGDGPAPQPGTAQRAP